MFTRYCSEPRPPRARPDSPRCAVGSSPPSARQHQRMPEGGPAHTIGGLRGNRTGATMSARFGINAFGRIGRNFLRTADEHGVRHGCQRQEPPGRIGRPLVRPAELLCAIVLALALTACGGGEHKSTTKSQTTSPSTSSTSQAPATGKSSVTDGPVRGTLSAQNHTPTVGKAWRHSVTVTDAAGHPLSGRSSTPPRARSRSTGRSRSRDERPAPATHRRASRSATTN